MSAIAGYTGRLFFSSIEAFFTVSLLAVDTLTWAVAAPVQGKGLRVRYAVEQFVEYGYRSLPVVMLISFLIGVTIALQSAVQLEAFGVVHLVANLVGVGAMRELGPLITAIIITGRSGSAITAEIGTMKVAEELDALEVMGVNATKFLVAPKFLAMAFAVPMVTTISIFTMIMGGAFVAITVIGMDSQLYLTQTVEALVLKDFVVGMTKSFFFGIVICWVGVYRGFQVEGGAEGVGKRTTSSVVTSIFLIIFVDTIFTILFNSNIL